MDDNVNNSTLKEAQELILEYVKDYFDEKVVADVMKVLRETPVTFLDPKDDNGLGTIAPKEGIYDYKSVGGYASDEGIFLPHSAVSYSKNIEFERDITIGLIIHEYAHILRKINSKYGNMFEEGFATIFAEVCLIHSKLKKQKSSNQKLIQPQVYNNTGWKYQKSESQIRSILYVLNQQGLDIKLIGEYIFGNQEVFKEKCTEIFGKEFATYFDLANSSKDQYYNDYENNEQNSEIMLVDIISDYIKQKGLNISDYWDQNHIVQYNKRAETLCKAVTKVGISSIREEDKHIFELFESSTKMINQESEDIIIERIARIRKVVKSKYSLDGKSKEEIYDTIIDLCAEYVQRKDSDRKENKLFIEELKRIIPNLDEFTKKFIKLRHITPSTSIFDEINNTNDISYEKINSIISSMLEKFEAQKNTKELETVFNDCNTKEKLLSTILEIDKYKDKIDLEKFFPNYSDFKKFIIELEPQISSIFDFKTKWNYETLYNKVLEMYLYKKEDDLIQLKNIKESYSTSLEDITEQYKVVTNESNFNKINSYNEDLNNSLETENKTLENETAKRNNNQSKKEEILSKKAELQRKNIIVRLFKRSEIKMLTNKIEELEKEIDSNDTIIEDIRNKISKLQSQIQDNEQQLIELCGLTISKYSSILKKCKSEEITEGKLQEKMSEIKKEIAKLEISKKEQELQELYKKNGISRIEYLAQQNDNNKSK